MRRIASARRRRADTRHGHELPAPALSPASSPGLHCSLALAMVPTALRVVSPASRPGLHCRAEGYSTHSLLSAPLPGLTAGAPLHDGARREFDEVDARPSGLIAEAPSRRRRPRGAAMFRHPIPSLASGAGEFQSPETRPPFPRSAIRQQRRPASDPIDMAVLDSNGELLADCRFPHGEAANDDGTGPAAENRVGLTLTARF